MTAKMRRRRRQARAKRLRTERREDGLFYAHGTIPASATAASICSCGARAFARGEHLDDFQEAHADCGDSAA